MRNTPTRPVDRASQEGSAYFLVLMLLFVLTIIGVALGMITQAEVTIGSNERSIQRVFYAAESGISIASSRVDGRDGQDKTFAQFAFDVKGSASGDASTLGTDRVSVLPVVAIHWGPCDLCEITQGKEHYNINYAIVSQATRLMGPLSAPPDPVDVAAGLSGGGGGGIGTIDRGTPIARKTIVVMHEKHVQTEPPIEALEVSPDPVVRAKVLQKYQF